MAASFWNGLPRPFFVLAPMANVTDAAFRCLIAACGKPDVTWTEFVSADGLMSPGREVLLNDLKYTEAERPIVAQLFSARPAMMRRAARLVAELGFDGLDINMGCPDRAVERQGAGAALIKTPALAQELIAAAREGALEAGRELPISVKTRTGYRRDELQTWLPALLEARPAAVTIHARTRQEMSAVAARWETVQEAVAIRNATKSEALIIGNGDVADLESARARAAGSGADGVMLGRAIFGNPWLFAKGGAPKSLADRLQTLRRHVELFDELLGGVKSFAIMKKHFKAYVHGFSGAGEFRAKLMAANNARDVEKLLDESLRTMIHSSTDV